MREGKYTGARLGHPGEPRLHRDGDGCGIHPAAALENAPQPDAPAPRSPAMSLASSTDRITAPPRSPAGVAATSAPSRVRRASWLAPLIYTVLACALVLPAAVHGLPGAVTDTGMYVWWLQWVPHALSHGVNPLHSTAVLHPSGVNAMWNTSILLPSLLLWPVTALAGPVVSFDVLTVAAPALSAWAAFAALRRLVSRDAAAVAGGLLYGFSPYVVAHSLGHPNLSLAVFPPLALLLLHRILRGDRPVRAGALLGLASAAQLLTGEELLLTTALAAALCLAVLAMQHRAEVRARLPRLAHGLGAAVLVFAVLAAAPLAYQFLGPDRVTGRVQPALYGNDLDSFVVPSSLQLLAPAAAVQHSQAFTSLTGGVPVEVTAYLGLPLLLLLLAAPQLLRRSRVVRSAVPCALLLAVLSLGAHARHDGQVTSLPLPWLAADHVPLLQDAVPNRLMVFAYLLLAVVVAVAVERSLAMRAWRRRALALGALGVALLALVPRTLPSESAATPAFFTGAARHVTPGEVMLVAPWADQWSTAAMLWQAQADMQFSMPSGFLFGAGPADHPADPLEAALGSVDRGATLVPLRPALRAQLLADLRRLGVRDAVATTAPEVRLLTDLLGRAPEQVEGVSVWWRVDRAATG